MAAARTRVRSTRTRRRPTGTTARRSTRARSSSTTSSRGTRLTVVKRGSTAGMFDGTYLVHHASFGKNFLRTACNVLQHYNNVWEPKNRAEEERCVRELNNLGFTLRTGSRQTNQMITDKATGIMKLKNLRAYVAENDDAIVVTFRGSGVQGGAKAKLETLKNAIADSRCRMKKHRDFSGYIHSGFLAEYMCLQKSIIAAVRQCNYKEKPIFVTGFSLGAALATLALFDITRKLGASRKKPIYGYLFACPAVGDKKFVSELNKKVKKIYRFAHERDPVAQLPHGLFEQYQVAGRKLFVFGSSSGKKDTTPNNVRQVHHNDMEMNLEFSKMLGKAVKAKIMRSNLKLLCAWVSTKLIKDFFVPFARYHEGPFYKNCMMKICKEMKRTARNSSMAQAASMQNRLCKRWAIKAPGLKKK